MELREDDGYLLSWPPTGELYPEAKQLRAHTRVDHGSPQRDYGIMMAHADLVVSGKW